jgi:glutathione S-transferase
MRLSEQREASMVSSRAISPPTSRNDDPSAPPFTTDEDTISEKLARDAERPDTEEEPVWLVGNHCSVADLSFLTWANVVDRIGIDLGTEFPVTPNL